MKLLSAWEWSQPRLFLTPKTMLIKQKKIFQQLWECTSKTFRYRQCNWPTKTQLLLSVVSWQPSSLLHKGHASHGCSQPVNEGGRNDNAGWLWFKDKTSLHCMANEVVFTQPSIQSISLSLESDLHHNLMALPAPSLSLPLFPSQVFPLIKCLHVCSILGHCFLEDLINTVLNTFSTAHDWDS